MIKEQWSDSTGSYIRLSGDDKDRMCDRILTGNCVKGILPLDIEYVNGNREYVYETSGYKSLSETLEESPLSKAQWINVFLSLLSVEQELEDYLLDSEHMVINTDTVFLRHKDMTMACIYRAEHKAPLCEQLNRLCEQILKYPEYDREQTELIYRFHSLTVAKNVTVKQIRDFISDEGKDFHEEQRVTEKDEASQFRRFISGPVDKARGEKGLLHENSMSKNAKKPGAKKGLNVLSYLLPIGLVCTGIIIPTACLYLGILSSSVSGNIDIPKAVGAYAFFILVAVYGAFKLCPKRSQAMVWEDDDELSVCLLPQVSGLCTIPVGMFPWQIGRDEKSVDAVIDRDGISPIHARFDKESTSVYVTDEESSSGTLLNRSRLIPWEKTRLKDGDILSFGAASYVVEITEG